MTATADEDLPFPAWSMRSGDAPAVSLGWTEAAGREWAWGGGTGRGVRVAIVDSGIDVGHPLIGEIDAAMVAVTNEDDSISIVPDTEGDACGHGTACAGIVRSIAPEATIMSVRVIGHDFTGSGNALMAGLQWAIEQRADVVNMSLSTSHHKFVRILRHLADIAYFQRTLLVASAHNQAKESFPWRFSSVLSVGSHEDTGDPQRLLVNDAPPVELFAAGVDVEVAWPGGGTARMTGNSFATAHVTALAAKALSKRPGLTPYELKTVLALACDNVVPAGGNGRVVAA